MAKALAVYRNFNGGLTESAPDNMKDNELSLARNAVPDEVGGIMKVNGIAPISATLLPEVPDILIEFGEDEDNVEYLAFGNKKMFNWDGTIISTTLNGSPLDWDIYNNKLYFLDGTQFWVYDGTDLTAAVKPTDTSTETWNFIKSCDFIEQRGQRHFYAKKGSSLLYYSAIGDPQAVADANVIKAVTDDADTITALIEYGGSLLVFKRKAIFKWSGWDPVVDVRFDKIISHTGTVSQYSVVRVEGMLIFVGDDGVYALTSPFPEQLSTVNLSRNKIEKIIRKAKNKDKIRASYCNGVYRVSLSNHEDFTNNVEYRLYLGITEEDAGSWFGDFTFPISFYCNSNYSNEMFMCSPGKKKIFKCAGETANPYLYDGEPIPYKVTLKPFDLVGQMVRDSRVKRFYLAAKQFLAQESSIKVTLKADYREKAWEVNLDESMVWEKGIWGESMWGWTDLITKEINIGGLGKAKRVQVTIENNEADEPVLLYGVGFMYKPRKPRANRAGVEEV